MGREETTTVEINKGIHTELKTYCKVNGIKVKHLVNEAVKEYLKDQEDHEESNERNYNDKI